jgi:hypothetical protein
MAVVIEASTPADLDEIAALMATAFRTSPDARFLDRRLLEWKYFSPGPHWNGSRSYVLRKDDAICAHCAVWPLTFSVDGREQKAVCFVDWASGKQLPGAGIILMKKLLSYADLGIVAGGSADTQSVIPKLGFKQAGRIDSYARVVRPFQQYRRRPSQGLPRDAARLVRNFLWSFAPQPSIPSGWSTKQVQSFAASGVLPSPDSAPARSAEFLNYWLACPACPVKGYTIEAKGEPLGHFLLAKVGGQTRILDLRIAGENWPAGFQVATAAAMADPDTSEIFAVSTKPAVSDALLQAGFRRRGGVPIFFRDPANLVPPGGLLWNLADDDTGYIHDPQHPFST